MRKLLNRYFLSSYNYKYVKILRINFEKKINKDLIKLYFKFNFTYLCS